jgi:hypothetical protein
LTAAVILAAVIVLVILCRVVVREDAGHEDGDAAWYCLQLLALAVRMRHVPWPPVFFSGMLLIADTVLLDLRPVARLLLSCNVSTSLPSGDDERAFFLEWAPTLAAIGLAVAVDLVRRGKRMTYGHAMVLLRLYSPVLVIAACEALSCRTVRSLLLTCLFESVRPLVPLIRLGGQTRVLFSFRMVRIGWSQTPRSSVAGRPRHRPQARPR